jgi:hypothetical protein
VEECTGTLKKLWNGCGIKIIVAEPSGVCSRLLFSDTRMNRNKTNSFSSRCKMNNTLLLYPLVNPQSTTDLLSPSHFLDH